MDEIANYVQGFSLNIDFKTSVSTYKKLIDYSKNVCYVDYDYGKASGFVLGTLKNTDDGKDYVLIMTACHVLNGELHREKLGIKHCWENDKSGYVAFDYDEKHGEPTKWPMAKDKIIMEDEGLDFAVLALDPEAKPQVNPKVNLPDKEGLGKHVALKYKPSKDEVLHLVGHPAGKEKTIDHLFVMTNADTEAMLIAKKMEYLGDPNKMYYHCRSFEGASGSPYFQGDRLIGLHSGGVWLTIESNQGISDMEVGVPMCVILTRMLEIIKTSENPKLDENGFYMLFPNCPKL